MNLGPMFNSAPIHCYTFKMPPFVFPGYQKDNSSANYGPNGPNEPNDNNPPQGESINETTVEVELEPITVEELTDEAIHEDLETFDQARAIQEATVSHSLHPTLKHAIENVAYYFSNPWNITINLQNGDSGPEYLVTIGRSGYSGYFMSESLGAIVRDIIRMGRTESSNTEVYMYFCKNTIDNDHDRERVIEGFNTLGYKIMFKLIEYGVMTRNETIYGCHA